MLSEYVGIRLKLPMSIMNIEFYFDTFYTCIIGQLLSKV